MEQITIDEVTTISDTLLDSLYELLKQLDPGETPSLTHEQLREVIDAPDVYLIVATDRETGKIVGMTTTVIHKQLGGKKALFEEVVVHETSRGKGIGKKLMVEAMELAKRKGATVGELTSRPTRDAANKMYQGMGFSKRETNVYHITL